MGRFILQKMLVEIWEEKIMIRPKKELSESEIQHIRAQLDWVRSVVRHCADERMPQGPCKYCLGLYQLAMNQAIDAGVWDA